MSPTGPATRCSAAWQGAPLAGTAPHARGWLVLEQDLPWSARALADPRLDAAAQTVVAASAAVDAHDGPVKVLLARARGEAGGLKRFWYSEAGAPTLRIGHIEDLAAHIRAGGQVRHPPGSDSTTPLLFICVNGKRDQCCAVEGRAVLRGLGEHPQVLECSHVGGHRFAATGLLLPRGDVHGRLTTRDVPMILGAAARGETYLPTLRGNSALLPAQQAADITLRSHWTALHGRPVPGAVSWQADADRPGQWVGTVDGERWLADVREVSTGATAPESCGAEPNQMTTWEVELTPVS